MGSSVKANLIKGIKIENLVLSYNYLHKELFFIIFYL